MEAPARLAPTRPTSLVRLSSEVKGGIGWDGTKPRDCMNGKQKKALMGWHEYGNTRLSFMGIWLLSFSLPSDSPSGI